MKVEVNNDIDEFNNIKMKTCKIDEKPLAFVKPEIQGNKTVNNICVNNLLLLDHEVTNTETNYSGKGNVINYKTIIDLINDFSVKINDLESQIKKLNNRIEELEGCVVYNEDEKITI